MRTSVFRPMAALTVAISGLALVTIPVSADAGSRAAGSAGSGLAAYRAPLAWGRCAHGIPAPFQCATARVPLSYSDPSGAKIRLAVVRLPASDPAKRIGSLFVNFGGPGGPGVTDLVSRAYTVFSPQIRARFDLVSWDPRGVQYSTPRLNCFTSQAASQQYFASDPVFPYPQTKLRDSRYFKLNAELGADCQSRSGALLAHMSSEDSAQDLNLLREDTGNQELNYIGFSYGTVIGAIYANLYPDNIRSMVLDGTVDFVGNSTGHNPGDGANYPVDVRQGVDVGAQGVFNRFLSLCARAGRAACAFAAGPGTPASKWATLLQRAQAGKLSYQNLMTLAFYNMEDPIADWPGLASSLEHLYRSTAAGHALPGKAARALAASARAVTQQVMTGGGAAAPVPAGPVPAHPGNAASYTGNTEEAYYATQCADSLVPTSRGVYRTLGSTEDAKVPGFGRMVVYDMMPCATWPYMHSGGYDGPWNASKTTILVINASHDPFTPLAGAKTAVSELGNARLLIVDGDGHTSMYVEPSVCRDRYELAYLRQGTLPPLGKRCPVSKLPFGLP